MHKNKNIDYAVSFKLDIQYAIENDESPLLSDKDVNVMEWLINQAKKAEFYETALLRIGENKVEDPQKFAFMTLYEGKQIYEVFTLNENKLNKG
ncbi:hypothetical protein P4571_08140 [Niallia alba]|uniref:hypothetical protein n=1 Tax=Niallia alba TaxID=2729105 RepID=UPI002E2229E9|nr:hypothetical protein [Niallia alba]